MRHLFVINPVSKRVKGCLESVKEMIHAFFRDYPGVVYDIYVSEWCRDSVAYVQRYASEMHRECLASREKCDIARIHVMGGTGTLFEVVNSIIGFPNTQIAAYPYGTANSFLKYFRVRNERLFADMKSQVFGPAFPMDVVRCGNNYGICYGMMGLEAASNALGDRWIDKGMPGDLSYVMAAVSLVLGNRGTQNYVISMDDEEPIEGRFASVMVANAPCYGRNMVPAIDAHPDDGWLDVYVLKHHPSKLKMLRTIPKHVFGNYRKAADMVSHYRARRIAVSSDEVMSISIDGEIFYGTSMEFDVVPQAIRFVCPEGVDLAKLPRIYNRPREGVRGA